VAKGKAFVGVTADTTEVSALTGFLSTLSTQIKADVNMAPVLDYAHSAMSSKFDAYMSVIAPTAPNQFHHVYDWGRIGVPQNQLWKNVLRGRGANKYASFEFRASVLPVPLPEGNKKPFMRKHRFIYKAMVMEYNIGVSLRELRCLHSLTSAETLFSQRVRSSYKIPVEWEPLEHSQQLGPIGGVEQEQIKYSIVKSRECLREILTVAPYQDS